MTDVPEGYDVDPEFLKKWEESAKIASARFDTHMPDGTSDDDLLMTVLKGHLLIEEGMWAVLSKAFPNPQALRAMGLTFRRAVWLLRACYQPSLHDALFGVADRFNDL